MFEHGGFAKARKAFQAGWDALGHESWRVEFAVMLGHYVRLFPPLGSAVSFALPSRSEGWLGDG
jgi:hypothetical protein